MSPKKVAPKAEKEPEPRPERPAGSPPAAVVLARHGTVMMQRPARGFSFAEMTAAGVPVDAARRWGVMVDTRRRSSLDSNVNAIRTWGSNLRKEKKRGEVKKIAREASKLEREVKEEVVKVEKEVVSAEKKAKKRLSAAEKQAAKKVSRGKKPKASAKKSSS